MFWKRAVSKSQKLPFPVDFKLCPKIVQINAGALIPSGENLSRTAGLTDIISQDKLSVGIFVHLFAALCCSSLRANFPSLIKHTSRWFTTPRWALLIPGQLWSPTEWVGVDSRCRAVRVFIDNFEDAVTSLWSGKMVKDGNQDPRGEWTLLLKGSYLFWEK